jgi:2-dehydropantoate 2-reductase
VQDNGVKLLVLGAGGIGGYFGGRLAEAGVDVTFLVRPKRRAQLERDGLRIASPLGDVTLRVKTVEATELRPDYGAVLLACKAYDLDSAIDSIAPAMNDHCVIVPTLNGLAHLDRLDARFGRDSVMGGACAISVALDAEGVVRQAGTRQRIVFGERDGSKSARAQSLAAAFGKTKLDWELSSDVTLEMWEKIMFLAALAASTSMFRANLGEIISAPGGREAILELLALNIEIVTREGHPPRPATVEWARKTLTETPGLQASMLHDIEVGSPTEADHIVGWLLERSRKHGLDDKILALAYTHLKAYDARRTAGRLPRR